MRVNRTPAARSGFAEAKVHADARCQVTKEPDPYVT